MINQKVVAHADQTRPESVVRYVLGRKKVTYDERFGLKHDPLLTQPNDVHAETTGAFFVTNLSRSPIDFFFRQYPAPMLHFTGKEWRVVGKFLGNGNGLIVHH
ncbi:MAG TPA: hypothetical protein VK901_17795, partial [Nitrospiraceae bacterium]|nr:hypothetical protein [Nitrospiraceae bacterium]